MKKILLFVFMIVIFVSGCNGSSAKVSPVTKNISFNADVKYGNNTYVCKTEITAEGKMEATVEEPEDLKGMTIIFDGDKVTAEYMGMTYTPDISAMPAGNVVQMLYSIMKNVGTSEKFRRSEEKNYIFSGKMNDYEYDFSFSPSGLPLYLEIPDKNFKITFKNVTVT